MSMGMHILHHRLHFLHHCLTFLHHRPHHLHIWHILHHRLHFLHHCLTFLHHRLHGLCGITHGLHRVMHLLHGIMHGLHHVMHLLHGIMHGLHPQMMLLSHRLPSPTRILMWLIVSACRGSRRQQSRHEQYDGQGNPPGVLQTNHTFSPLLSHCPGTVISKRKKETSWYRLSIESIGVFFLNLRRENSV